jgi:SAM-dependent methyltransferase
MADYIATIYNETERPKTVYPGRLAAYLMEYAGLKPGMSLLEVGCGRCEFLRGFAACGLNVTGVDISPQAREYAPELPIFAADIEQDPLPFPDCSFDVVYSKSFIEHLWNPDKYFREAWRVLKEGGVLLTLVPDWESCYKIYFDDFTHRTPFTCVALHDLYRCCDFTEVSTRCFRQLPVTWKYPWMNIICRMIAPFVPVRTKIPFLRWSRELMVIGIGKKGKGK